MTEFARKEPVYQVRLGTQADLPFLEIILCEAAYWRPSDARPSLEDVKADPHLARYLSGWGRAGDLAVVAESRQRQAVGAAWCRLMPVTEPGFGFVDAGTPELTIGVLAEWRGQGIGKALLMALMREARRKGFRALSLSVAKDNQPAQALYRRCGFVPVETVDNSWTMRADLSGMASISSRGRRISRDVSTEN